MVEPSENKQPPKLLKTFQALDPTGPTMYVALWSDGHLTLCQVEPKDVKKSVCSKTECLDKPEECYKQAKEVFEKFNMKIVDVSLEEKKEE